MVRRRQVARGIAALGLAPLGNAARAERLRGRDLTAADIKAANGPLNVLGSQPYETRASWPTDLNITWAYNTTNEEILTKTTQPGTFDMVIIYQGEIDQLRKLDRIEPIDTSLLSNWNKIAPLFRDSDVIRRDGKVYAVPFHWGYGYLEYNADEIEAPTSYDDLMSPEADQEDRLAGRPLRGDHDLRDVRRRAQAQQPQPRRVRQDHQAPEELPAAGPHHPQLRRRGGAVRPQGHLGRLPGVLRLADAEPQGGRGEPPVHACWRRGATSTA